MTDADFWHERWARGEIGFHRSDVHPMLERHWREVAGGRPRVLVPLCGKSLDLHWLAARGHEVVGVELDEGAIRSFFDEAGATPTVVDEGPLRCWRAGAVTILQGDFFDYRPDRPFDAIYDRAALIALPEPDRARYLERLGRLLAGEGRGLLITLEYPQDAMTGPPFSVPAEELARYADAAALRFECLARQDALEEHPGFRERGLPWLRECAYRLSSAEET